VEHDDQPEKVLVAGWAGTTYMQDILLELDSGTACLPQVGLGVFWAVRGLAMGGRGVGRGGAPSAHACPSCLLEPKGRP
jgi:hypothetical protein